MEHNKLNGFQLRTARTALNITIKELSEATNISRSTILRLEKTLNFDLPKCHPSIALTLKNFYESEGIEFLGTQAIYLMNEGEKSKFKK